MSQDEVVRHVILHLLEPNQEDDEALWEVTVKISDAQERGLLTGNRLSFSQVVSRAHRLIRDEVTRRKQSDDFPDDYLDELWP